MHNGDHEVSAEPTDIFVPNVYNMVRFFVNAEKDCSSLKQQTKNNRRLSTKVSGQQSQ